MGRNVKPVPLHGADHRAEFERVAPKERWWEDYKAKTKELRAFLDKYPKETCWTYAKKLDIDKDGFLDWDLGQIRELVRMMFERYALSPPTSPALSKEAWHCIWVDFERDGQNLVDFEHSVNFVKFFAQRV